MLQKLRKRQRELEKSRILMNCTALKRKYMSFLCLLLAVWVMCWRIKGCPGISGIRWRKAFLSCILTSRRIYSKAILICIIIFFCMSKSDKRFALRYPTDKEDFMKKTSISSIGNLDMIERKPDQTVMSCELEDAESFYRFWQGLAYERIMIQMITSGSFIEDLSEFFKGYAYKVTKLAKR